MSIKIQSFHLLSIMSFVKNIIQDLTTSEINAYKKYQICNKNTETFDIFCKF